MKVIFSFFVIVFSAFSTLAQSTAAEINAKLGRGINFGDMFERPRESGWGAEVYPFYFEEIADKGFNSIRIPIKWSDYAQADPPYTIEQAYIDTIRSVVDQTLANHLMAVINMHHYDEIFTDPDGHTERFLMMWKQISHAFKDYPDSLVFELLNEPHDMLNQAKWNALFPVALDTVRMENPTRKVIIGPPDWNGIGSTDKLAWPENDTNLIMTVHYYNPFEFTHQGAGWVSGSDAWLGTTWDSTASQLQAVINDFAEVRSVAASLDVPVYVGEFGAYSKADMNSRKKWTAYMARIIESFGFSWAYWEFKSGFGAYDPADGIWRNELLYALTEQIDSLSIPPDPWEIGNPDFSRGLDGWSFYTQGGAVATIDGTNQEADINIVTPGDQSWHIQFTQTDIELVKGAQYRFSFDARYEGTASNIQPYLGKNADPWTNYSGWHTYTLKDTFNTYSFSFTMTNPTDPDSRVVFDLSYQTTRILIDNVFLELLAMPVYVEQITINPDPASIDTYKGTLQLSADIDPGDASDKSLNWEIVSGGTLANISSNGLLEATGSGDGTVVVRASALDESGVSDELTVDISNQTTATELNLADNFQAFYTGERFEFFIPQRQTQRTYSLYSLDGRLICSTHIPPGSNHGIIPVRQLHQNIFILKITGDPDGDYSQLLFNAGNIF